MGRKPRNQTTNLAQPGGAIRAQRQQQQYKTKTGSKKGKWSGGFGLGTLGLICAVAGGCLFGVSSVLQKRRSKAASDSSVLTSILNKPMKYTEHAKCRMDCRYADAADALALPYSVSRSPRRTDSNPPGTFPTRISLTFYEKARSILRRVIPGVADISASSDCLSA